MRPVPAQPWSDGEETCGSAAAPAAPVELRIARRHAATALVVSALAFLGSCCIVLRSGPAAAPSIADKPAETELVGLSQEMLPAEDEQMQAFNNGMDGLLTEVKSLQYGVKLAPHHLGAVQILRLEPSPDGAVQRQLPMGLQVFPLTRRAGWVHVLVPQAEVGGEHQTSTFGWLPEKSEDGKELLVMDTEFINAGHSQWREHPPTEAEVASRWDAVRAKNVELKSQIANLEAKMQGGGALGGRPPVPRAQARQAAKEEVSNAIDIKQLSKAINQVRSSLPKELNFKALGKALAK